MSTVNKQGIKTEYQLGGAPYGNGWRQAFRFETNSSGILMASNKATAIANADVVRIGVLPAGLELHDALMIVSDAFTAATTADVGFQYVDGVDVTAVPEDADYFGSAIATNAQGRYPSDNVAVAPVVLPKEAYLILTIGGANHASAGVMDVIIMGIHRGTP